MRVLMVTPDPVECDWEWIVAGARSIDTGGAIQIIDAAADRIDDVIRAQPAPFDAAIVRVRGHHDLPFLEAIAARSMLVVTIGPAPGGYGVVGEVVIDSDAPSLLSDELVELLAERRSYLLGYGSEHDLDEAALLRFENAMSVRFDLRRLDQAALSGDFTADLEAMRSISRRFQFAGAIVTLTPTLWLDPLPSDAEPFPASAPDQTSAPAVLTLGSCPGLWDAIRAGRVTAAVGPLAGNIGREAILRCMEVVSSSTAKSVRVFIPVEVIRADNLDDFQRRYLQAAGRPIETAVSIP